MKVLYSVIAHGGTKDKIVKNLPGGSLFKVNSRNHDFFLPQNNTRCNTFDSKSNTLEYVCPKSCYVLNLLFHILICCKNLVSKSDTIWIFWSKNTFLKRKFAAESHFLKKTKEYTFWRFHGVVNFETWLLKLSFLSKSDSLKFSKISKPVVFEFSISQSDKLF